MDWTAHLEHLQTVLREFNANAVISEPVLISLFRDGLRPSIHAQAKQKGCQKGILDQAIRKAITAKAKTVFNLPFWVRKMDACCLRGHHFASKHTEDHLRDQVSLLFLSHKAQAMLPHCSKPIETERPRRDHQKSRRNRNVAIAAPAAPGLRALPRPLGSTPPRSRLETIVIMAITGKRVKKIGTWAKPLVTIVTRRGILLTNVLSPTSQKNSISLGNFLVGDWY